HVPWKMLVLPHFSMGARDVFPREHFRHAGIYSPLHDKPVGLGGLLEIGKMRTLNAFLAHPDVSRIKGQIVARSTSPEDDHASALHDQTRDRECLLAWVLEHHVDVVAFAGNLPNRLAELAGFPRPRVIFRRADLRHLTPATEVFSVDHAFGAERKHKL